MKTLHRECSVNRQSVAHSTQDSRAATVNERGSFGLRTRGPGYIDMYSLFSIFYIYFHAVGARYGSRYTFALVWAKKDIPAREILKNTNLREMSV